MTRIAIPLLLLALPAAAGPEALRLQAARAFRAAASQDVPPDAPREPVFRPALRPLPLAGRARGAVVAQVALAAQLDRQRRLLARQFGSKPWDLGVASDPGLRNYYLVFSEPGSSAYALAPLGDLNRLSGAGVEARLDASTVYHFKVAPNLFSPTRGSTLQMRPTQGTRGPQHDVKTGALLDAVEARAAVFRARGKQYWLHYATDVKTDGSGFVDTRSFLFIHENGLSSRIWPLAESRLPLDAAVTVDLDGTRLSLLRSSRGELVVAELP